MNSHIYTNIDKTALVVVNQKCGFSSMEFHAQQGQIIKISSTNQEKWKIFGHPNIFKMFMIRNPYGRLESFYKHWIKMHPTLKESEMMRKSTYFDSFSEIFSSEKFLNRNISFEEFIVKGLPPLLGGPQTVAEWLDELEEKPDLRFHSSDAHLILQTRSLKNWHIGIEKFDEIIRLEKKNFDNLNSKMGIELCHHNSTSTEKWKNFDLRWSAKMKHIAYQIYLEDFETLGYNKGSRVTSMESTL